MVLILKARIFFIELLQESDNGCPVICRIGFVFPNIKMKPQSNKNKYHFHLFLTVFLFLKQGKEPSVD